MTDLKALQRRKQEKKSEQLRRVIESIEKQYMEVENV